MDQNETYKRALGHINQLEEQLSSINNNQVDFKAMEEQIEVHFNKCLNTLAARKDKLLRDLAEKASTQRKLVEEARTEVQQVVQAQREILNAGATAFKFDSKSAELVWKGVLNMNPPPFFRAHITLDLPESLSTAIEDHGKVFLGEIPAIKNSATTEIDFSRNPKVVPFAGSSAGFEDGQAARAKFNVPRGICWSTASNCFFVCDTRNSAIRKITLQGVVSTFVQGGKLKSPHGIAIHQMSNELFVTNQVAHNILKITSAGDISVLAGSGEAGRSDGTGLAASFSSPNGITIDQQTGNLFVSDYSNHLIRKITPQGVVLTLAGSIAGYKDGKAAIAQFNSPWGICFCARDQSLLVCDSGTQKLRQVLLNGEVTTVCDVPSPSFVLETQNSFLVSSYFSKKLFTIQGDRVSAQNITLEYGPTGIVVQGSSCYVVQKDTIIQINYS